MYKNNRLVARSKVHCFLRVFTKSREFYIYSSIDSNKLLKKPIILNADKIFKQKLSETNPDLAKDSSFQFVRVDPISGDPVIYTKARLKEYYQVWKDEFLVGKQLVRDIDRDSMCLFIYVEKILGDNVNIGVYTKFKEHKVEFIIRDLGKVRTKKESYLNGIYAVEIAKIHKILNWYKYRKIKKNKKKLDSISLSLMDFILNEGDFIHRTTDQLVDYYWPNFNF